MGHHASSMLGTGFIEHTLMLEVQRGFELVAVLEVISNPHE